MTDRDIMQQALEALEADEHDMVPNQEGHMVFRKGAAIAALNERLAQPEQEPVADRAFLERTLVAMEGVIDVADRKTDEFDALRSCIIELTLMLYKKPQHVTDGSKCWCEPELDYKDPITGVEVWVHKEST